MSDKANSDLYGEVNKQNVRHWAPENPRNIHEQSEHLDSHRVWCAIGLTDIISLNILVVPSPLFLIATFRCYIFYARTTQ